MAAAAGACGVMIMVAVATMHGEHAGEAASSHGTVAMRGKEGQEVKLSTPRPAEPVLGEEGARKARKRLAQGQQRQEVKPGTPRPPEVRVTCETTKGNFSIRMVREWAPSAHDRFLELANARFFDGQLIYRMLPGFLVQFGVAADAEVQRKWQERTIPDDEQKNIPFSQGTVSFAGNGKHSRSTHIFISLDPHGRSLGKADHERPFGRIDDPQQQQMIASFYHGYGDITELQGSLMRRGNGAASDYPLLDRIKSCRVEPSLVETARGRLAEGSTLALPLPISRDSPKLWLHVEGVGSIPIMMSAGSSTRKTQAKLLDLAAKGTSGRVHRAEAVPSAGSIGPPYALVQFTLDDGTLASLQHEGSSHIARGSVCLIGRSSDLFISLARQGEHRGWETSMTVVGRVPEPALSSLVESRILSLPKHNFTHPKFGTVMSMLNRPLPCRVRTHG